MNEQVKKIYRVVITEVNVETGEEIEQLNDEYSGLTLMADNLDRESSAEVIIHDTIMNIAAKMCSGVKIKHAVRLANLMLRMEQDKNEEMEDMLMSMLGGIQ